MLEVSYLLRFLVSNWRKKTILRQFVYEGSSPPPNYCCSGNKGDTCKELLRKLGLVVIIETYCRFIYIYIIFVMICITVICVIYVILKSFHYSKIYGNKFILLEIQNKSKQCSPNIWLILTLYLTLYNLIF